MKPIKFLIQLFVLYFFSGIINAQNDSTINLYLKCDQCEKEYIVNELNFINYVRDINYANVILMGISESTGNGGTKTRLIFEGRKNFQGMNDTIIFNINYDATNNEIRNLYTKNIKFGLLPYIIKTPLKENIEIEFSQSNLNEQNKLVDPWNNWVFSISLQNYASGEESRKSLNINSRINAEQITEKSKILIGFNNNFSRNTFTYDDYTYDYLNISYGSYLYYVKSLGKHWSAGIFTSAGNSTFSNYDFYGSIYPAIEYNIFPYDKSFEKQFRISYRIGPAYFDYTDTTIFLKTKELVPQQKLNLNLGIVKNWGSIDLSIYGSQFLHDIELFSLGTYVYSSLRIIKGFSLFFYGGYSMIRNQINISKVDISQEELLLQQRQMKTNYSYWTNFGFSYTFGSKFNNVVNTRFE